MAQVLVLSAEQSALAQQQELSKRLSILKLFKYRKRIAQLQKKILFYRKRAAEHDDDYFIFLGVLTALIDFADTFDVILAAIIGFFTWWVPLAMTALFRFGPRHYVWNGDTNSAILTITQISFKMIPWARALPLNVSKVAFHWNLSFVHKENDLRNAKKYEKELNRLLKHLKRGKL